MSYDTVPCHESQSANCFHNWTYLFVFNSYLSFPNSQNNSYLRLKKFCFKIAKCKFGNIEENQQDTSLQVRLLAEEISILELLSSYYWKEKSFAFTENNPHAVWTESKHTSRWTEKKEEGGWERVKLVCNPAPSMKWKQLVCLSCRLRLDK